MNSLQIVKVPLTTGCAAAFLQLNGKLISRGYGTLGSEVPHITSALNADVNFFDSAHFTYNSAAKIQNATLLSDNKGQIVVAEKIPGWKLDRNNLVGSFVGAFDQIRATSGRDKIDILALHGPDCFHEVIFDKLMELKEEGKVQYIGVSNITADKLIKILAKGKQIDVVDNEWNLLYHDDAVLEICKERGIVFVGARIFGDQKGKDYNIFEHKVVKEVAARVNASARAVMLQWANQRGVTVVPHSNNAKNVIDNHTIPEWTLTSEELDKLDAVRQTSYYQKFLNKDLLKESEKWLNSVADAKK